MRFLAVFWAASILLITNQSQASVDRPTANARVVAAAALEGDPISMSRALQQRRALATNDLADWLALEIALDPGMHDKGPPWAALLRKSMAAHFEYMPVKALDYAEEAVLTAPLENPELLPGLWLANLEIWPRHIESFEAFVSLRETGKARLQLLYDLYPQDRRAALMMMRSLIADGRISDGFMLMGEIKRQSDLPEGWDAELAYLSRWKPALKSEDLRRMADAGSDDGTFVLAELNRLEPEPLSVLGYNNLDADVNTMPPLHKLAATGDLATIERILPAVSELDPVAERGGAAYTPLHLAAEMGNLAALEAFADAGADLNRPADPVAGLEEISKTLGVGVPGATPLQIASLHGQSDLAKALIALGAEVEPAAGSGQIAPLLAATARGDAELASKLIGAGADPQIGYGDFGSALGFAQKMPGTPMLEQLTAAAGSGRGAAMPMMSGLGMATQGLGAGMGAPYQALATAVLGLAASEAGREWFLHGLWISWQNGTLLFRFGMIASLLFAGFLFKSGPRLLINALSRIGDDRDAREELDAIHRFDAEKRCYVGKIEAYEFGLVEGGEVEFRPEAMTVHGYAARSPWLYNSVFFKLARFGLFLLLFAALGLFWSVFMIGFGLSASPAAHAVSGIFLLILIPVLSLTAEGIVRLLTTTPRSIDIFRDEVTKLSVHRVKRGLELIADIRKPGRLHGEFRFEASHANTVNALTAQLEQFAAVRQLRLS